MNQFDFWQRWGIDLDDSQFANAWSALGVAAAGAAPAATPPRDRIGAALGRVRDDRLLPWRFPKAPPSGQPGLLRDSRAADWAQAWVDLLRNFSYQPRLRVRAAPGSEPILPWLRLLAESDPTVSAISLETGAPRAVLRIEWPLRLGYWADNAAAALIEQTRTDWPANELTRAVSLGREQANCDLLTYSGTTRTLLMQLLAHPRQVKANMIVLRGPLEGDWGGEASRLAAILSETRASGYLLLPRGAEEQEVARALNHFVAELSHSLPIDEALAASCLRARQLDPVAALTPALLAFRLSDWTARLNRRLRSLPAGSELDLSQIGTSHGWLTRGTRSSALPRRGAAAAPREERHVAARGVAVDPDALVFEHESRGGSVLASMSAALEEANVPDRAEAARNSRFLQQRSFVRDAGKYSEAEHGFVADRPALVRVRIGPPERDWDTLPQAFPVEQLPEHLDRWTLTVWLAEPTQLAMPLKGTIRLPRDGPSTECEFRFRPRVAGRFEGRISVLHRGRVLQTAVLRAAVLAAPDKGSREGAPRLEEFVPVRTHLGDLRGRRRFDLAYVLNHTSDDKPLANGLSADHAWIVNLKESLDIAQRINASLSRVAKSVADYADGLDGEKGRALLVDLARQGRWLHLYLVEQQLAATGNRPDVAAREYLQVVSTRTDAVVPFEFIYEYETPEKEAKLCQRWRQALEHGACPDTCNKSSSQTVCPMGFWGVSKVIERHALTPELAKEGRELFLQSEPAPQRDEIDLSGKAVFGSSSRVVATDLDPLRLEVRQRTGSDGEQATDWSNWEALVGELKPRLLIALPHTDGSGHAVTLELGGKSIETIDIKTSHVRPDPAGAHPLVALLGCDTTGTASDYGNHVLVFRARGAAIVIGTIATVFGEHAARVATMLVSGLLPAGTHGPLRLGEALRKLKRDALLAKLLMPLCLVAYGDADWKLVQH